MKLLIDTFDLLSPHEEMTHHLKGRFVIQTIINNGNGQRLNVISIDHTFLEQVFDVVNIDEQGFDKEIIPTRKISVQG